MEREGEREREGENGKEGGTVTRKEGGRERRREGGREGGRLWEGSVMGSEKAEATSERVDEREKEVTRER